MRTSAMFLAAVLMAAPALRAQIVADGATRTLINETNSFPGDVTVGTNGLFTMLIASTNALLTNSANGIIGRNATARSNEVRLLSASSRWLMGGQLFVGNDGSFNRLVVSNGATVRDNNGFIGPNAPGSNNVAVVTGPGSVWSNANVFYLGFNGAGNQLIVSNGGVLRANVSDVGLSSSSSNNLAVVTGSGSLWTNAFELQFGFNGAGNQLVISNGGVVRSSLGYLGSLAPASNNVALVTGPGSLWTNATDLFVGNSGAGNRLIVSDGGAVRNGHGYVGDNTTASNNLALITGTGSVWSNALDLNIGAFSSNNRMIVSNGATVFAANNGFIGPTANGNANSVTVTDPGTRWQANNLFVGDNGRFNSLVVSNGGLVESSFAEIGRNAPGDDNEALVTGAGSLWTTPGLLLGDAGSGNRLVVSNGAALRSDISFIGFFSVNNTALVTGSGSVWSNTSVLVGRSGSSNRLIANNGATVSTTAHGFIGFNTNANGNSATVTDPGTLWLISSNLYVGSNGAFSGFTVSNGGEVRSTGRATIGFNSTSVSNVAMVTGAGSLWTNLDVLELGESGGGNRLVVSSGGVLRILRCGVGGQPSSDNNEALVTGEGSSWLMRDGLDLGISGSGNRLVISNGAWMFNSVGGGVSSSAIGVGPQSGDNEAVVTGVGSSWLNLARLSIGVAGSRNRLVVTNSGAFISPRIIIGESSSSSNNRVVVDGGTMRATNATGTGVLEPRRGTNALNAGLIEADLLVLTNALGRIEINGGTLITRGTFSTNNLPVIVGTTGTTPATWHVRAGTSNHVITGQMVLGNFASFNQLLLTNGAFLTNSLDAIIGNNSGANSNTAVVSGLGSRWAVDRNLGIGYAGSFNRLDISSGGSVASGFSLIGFLNAGSNNVALVTGAGSEWRSFGELHVGDRGKGNLLFVTNGGAVFTGAEQIIGNDSGADSNTVIVKDVGSRWLGSNSLDVGRGGSFNRLFVSNGGQVMSGMGTLGSLASGNSNLAVVADAGSLWTNRFNLMIGESGSANLLVVSNGGLVTCGAGMVGTLPSATANSVLVSGANTRWLLGGDLYAGSNGAFNAVTVSDGAFVSSADGVIGFGPAALGNVGVVSGTGTIWNTRETLGIGYSGSANRLEVRDGARVESEFGILGLNSSSSNNEAAVTGPGSFWTNSGSFYVGVAGRGNRLVISNGGEVLSFDLILGSEVSSTNNRIVVDGGVLRALGSNPGLDIRRGTNILNAGLIAAQQLRLTNAQGFFEFNGGTLITRGAVISNSQPFSVGRTGVPAVWHVRAGAGNHALASSLLIGDNGSFCQLLVTNGASLTSGEGSIGFGSAAHFNSAIIAGAGSRWDMGPEDFDIGESGSGNALVVSNGGSVISGFADIGESTGDTNNEVVVTGSNSVWNLLDGLRMGRAGAGNRTLITDGGTVTVSNVLTVGAFFMTSSNNLLLVANGTLLVTNGAATGRLDVRNGTNRLDAGLIEVDRLVITNGRGEFVFNGGTLRTAGTTIGHGRVFTVGNGTSTATLELRGGAHVFLGGLIVANHASLTGNGTLAGALTVQAGGALSPGTSIGMLAFNSAPLLQGATVMEISRNGATLTNDLIQVTGTLNYGGSLVVTNIGPTALVAGDRFRLFNAATYAGSFSSISLPPLASGLAFTNKLTVDGSIEVVASATSLPTLTIQRSNDVLLVSWPTNASNFCLETTFDLAPPVFWQPVSSGITTNSSSFVFSLANVSAQPKQFFRLAFPCSAAPVSLSIQLSNNLVTVSWPSNAFRLESTLSLPPSASWQTISNGISDNSSLRTFTFTNTPAVTNQFFRLAFP